MKLSLELLSEKRELKEKLYRIRAQEGSILHYTKYTFPGYQVNWHHRLLAKYLDQFIQKKIKRLMIFMPPRHGKSELTSRRLPSLLHGLYPNDEIIGASYNNDLAGDMTVDIQRILERKEFKDIFPEVRITPDGSKTSYTRSRNEHEIIPYQDPEDKLWKMFQGSYKSSGVGGSFTGRGANWILLDDLIKNREDADSFAYREKLWKWYQSTIRSRLEGEGSILLTMTRWHDDDIAGRLLALAESDPDADQWTVLTLPAICENFDNPEDPRMIGEPLWPSKFDEKALSATKASSGSREWSALYQQSPMTDGGNIVKEEWIKYYTELPKRFDSIIQSWDFATKDKATSDFTVGQVWGRIGVDKYLIASKRGRFDFPTACQKLLDLTAENPKAHKKLVESKANGPAVVQTLKSKVTGLVEVEPRGDKTARLHAVSPEFESGKVFIPSPEWQPWVKEFVRELLMFPNGSNDDQVDTATQALDELRKAGPLYLPISGHSGTLY